MYKLVVLAMCVAFIASANAQLLGGGGMMEAMLLSQMLQNNNQNTGSSSASSTSASRPGVLGVLGGSGSSSTSSSNPFASMFGSGGNPQLFGNMGRLMMLQGNTETMMDMWMGCGMWNIPSYLCLHRYML